MAGKLKEFLVHGAFDTKAAAKRKEQEVGGGFVRRTSIKGKKRFLVLTRR